MALVEIKDPTERDLRIFGALLVPFFALLGGLVWWRSGSVFAVEVIGGVAIAMTAVFFLVPSWRRRIYFGWIYAVYPIGWVVSHTLLASIYYLVFTPVGVAMRLVGYDPLQRKLDPAAATYWIPRDAEERKDRYFKQF